ncbi:MFS like protein [Aspergillus parasiticus SU-1]|uniref:MFS like protein n=1 Tax=Aspergillus parasiticus (strain ATCC 56775 / NRRL 5862 / SRRC 143 / SU-1) TaxID=1403190 RepID=A0A0F0ID58_ASPPU|nr:MFS like protein [Aspergillus parasiticus SU-1]
MSDDPSDQQDAKLTPSMASAAWKPDFRDGGLRAWSVAAGAAGLMFCAFGYVNSFGVYQEYYLFNQLSTRPPNDISWIGSLEVFFLFSGILIGGPLFDRYAINHEIDTLAKCPSLRLLRYDDQSLQPLLSISVGPGHFGRNYIRHDHPGLAGVSHYFFHNRGAALGIAVGGSSLGGVIFPIALTKMLNNPNLGFGLSVRICAFLVLVSLSKPPISQHGALQSLPGDGALHTNVSPPHLRQACTRHVATALTLSRRYAKWWLILWPHHLGYSRQSTARPFNVLGISGLATGIMCFWWTRAHSAGAIIVFSVIYGFTSGAVVSMLSACFAQIPKDPHDWRTYFGISMFCAAFGALIGIPISGVLVSQSGGFETPPIFSGVMTTFGSCMVLSLKLLSGKGVWSRY